MALHISEYQSFRDGVPVEPCLATQVVPVDSEGHVSAKLRESTRFIRLHAQEPCFIIVGENPKASDTGTFIAANTPENIAVAGGQRVAVMGLANQAQGDGTFALLQVVADPKAAQARMVELNAAAAANAKSAADSKAALTELDRQKSTLDVRQKDLELREAKIAALGESLRITEASFQARMASIGTAERTHQETMAARTQKLAAEQTAFDKATAEVDKRQTATVQKLHDREAAVAAREKSVAAREEALSNREAKYTKRIAAIKAAEEAAAE